MGWGFGDRRRIRPSLLLLFAFKVNCALNVHGGASYTFGALTILVLLPMRTYSETSSLPEACQSPPAIPPWAVAIIREVMLRLYQGPYQGGGCGLLRAKLQVRYKTPGLVPRAVSDAQGQGAGVVS